ncbi:MAG TPA: hypothetical protein PKC20_19645, partial [Burkholderiaceae bacterium]|nr:hypothetical protein [Burkholderiaceae bacterium]
MRIGDGLRGKRVLVTQSEAFMGPVLAEAFAAHGAEVIGVPGPLAAPGLAEAAVRGAGRVDVLVANLGVPAPSTRAHEVGDDEFREVFAHMVDPLPRLARAGLRLDARGLAGGELAAWLGSGPTLELRDGRLQGALQAEL